MAKIKINYLGFGDDLTQEIHFKTDQDYIKLFRVIQTYCLKHKLNHKLVRNNALKTSERDLVQYFDPEHK